MTRKNQFDPVSLTPIEHSILHTLMSQRGKFSLGGNLPRRVERFGYRHRNNRGGTYTSSARKIEINPSEPRYIKMVRERGYIFEKGAN